MQPMTYAEKARSLRILGFMVSYRGRSSQNTSQAKSAVTKLWNTAGRLKQDKDWQFVKAKPQAKSQIKDTFRDVKNTPKGVFIKKPKDPTSGQAVGKFNVRVDKTGVSFSTGKKSVEQVVKINRRALLKQLSGGKKNYLKELLKKSRKGRKVRGVQVMVDGRIAHTLRDWSSIERYLVKLFEESNEENSENGWRVSQFALQIQY